MTEDNIIKKFLEKYSKEEYQVNLGSSLLLIQGEEIVFTLTKEKSWEEAEKYTKVKFSGIGGSVESSETRFECMLREINEEVGLKKDKINFLKNNKTILISKTGISSVRLNSESSNINPLYIIELELPIRPEYRKSGKKTSCLQLFVYLAEIEEDFILEATEVDLPGLLFVHGCVLDEILNGEIVFNTNNYNKQVLIKWNTSFCAEKVPKNILLLPQFTAKGLKSTGLTFQELKSLLSRSNGYE